MSHRQARIARKAHQRATGQHYIHPAKTPTGPYRTAKERQLDRRAERALEQKATGLIASLGASLSRARKALTR